MSMEQPEVLAGDGIVFPEGPRWHDDKLWFVDMFGGTVMTADLTGSTEVVGRFDDRTSGLGFLPDGTAIVVLMAQKKIVRVHDGGIHADLSSLDGEFLNDMVVDETGRAWVDLLMPRPDDPSIENGDAIFVVEPDGSFFEGVRGGLFRPNGIAITPDHSTLISGMGPVHSVVAYSIAENGALSERRIYADTGGEGIDGLCLDEEGAVWIASPRTHHFVRVREGGRVDRVIDVGDGRWAIACVLGGPDRRTLFLATADVPPDPRGGLDGNLHLSKGYIEIVEVDVPGAGLP